MKEEKGLLPKLARKYQKRLVVNKRTWTSEWNGMVTKCENRGKSTLFRYSMDRQMKRQRVDLAPSNSYIIFYIGKFYLLSIYLCIFFKYFLNIQNISFWCIKFSFHIKCLLPLNITKKNDYEYFSNFTSLL
jgi:hypothetical protein